MDLSDNYVKSSRRIVVDFNLLQMHALPFDKFDPEDFVATAASGHVDCLWHFAKDHNGYALYRTKVGIRNVRVDSDLLGEMIRCGHARGIKILAYYSLGFDTAVIRAHPDWGIVDAEGKAVNYGWSGVLEFGVPCFNSPYRRYALDQIAEIVGGYDIDLFWIDILQQTVGGAEKPGCYCAHCEQAYQERFGRSIPREANWDSAWKQQVNWRLDVIEQFWGQIVHTVHERKPGVPVSRNIDWGMMDGTMQRSRFVAGEEYADADAVEEHHSAVVLRGLAGRKAFHFCINHCPGPTQDRVSPYRYRYLTMYHLTHGGNSAYATFESGLYADGTLDKEYFRILSPAFAEKAEKEEHLRGAISFPYLAIMHSDATRVFYRADENYRERFMIPLIGALSVPLTMHVPYDVLPEPHVASDALRDHTLLILPNVAAMTKSLANAVKTYVREGGLLIGSFQTSRFDEEGEELADFQLAEVFGLKCVGRSDRDPNLTYHHPTSYVAPRGHEIFNGLPGELLRFRGPYVRTEAASGQTIACSWEPAELTIGGKRFSWGTMPGEETPYPAIHVNAYGRGQAVFIASRIFRQCGKFEWRHMWWWSRKLIANIIRFLDPHPPLRVEAPETVEATFWLHAARGQIIVQLLNKTSRESLIPVEGIKISVRQDLDSLAEAYIPWPERKELAISRRSDRAEIAVPRIGLHKIVILLRRLP